MSEAKEETSQVERLVICTKCKREWPITSEQGVCIEWHNQCAVCKFTPQGEGSNDGSKEELDLVAEESLKRLAGQHACV